MAASRRRSSGFTEAPKEDTEAKEVQEFLDQAATELLESMEKEEAEPVPFVEESIVPSDGKPRFIEEPPAPAPAETPVLAPRPKLPRRPQRNVPRFSRTK